MESLTQAGICRNASCNCHTFYVRNFNSFLQFFHKNIDNRMLKRCSKVFFVMFNEVCVFFYVFSEFIQKRSR